MTTNNDNTPVLVTIYTLVYNHEPYLRQCLEGLVMQKTNFKFKCFVHDDASTDNSAAIIKEYVAKYPELFDVVLENENQYSKHDGSLERIIEQHLEGKYIAICEGDDYWTDPLKLQKQVDTLESNPSISLVYTGFKNVDTAGKLIGRSYYEKLCSKSPSGDILGNLFQRNCIMTATVVYRKDIYDSKLYKDSPGFYDYSIFLSAAMLGKIIFLKEKMACYRMTPGSLIVSHKKDLKPVFDQIFVYFSKAFLDGEGFGRTFFQRFKIYGSIVLGALNNNDRLRIILKNKKLLAIYPFILFYSFAIRAWSKLNRSI